LAGLKGKLDLRGVQRSLEEETTHVGRGKETYYWYYAYSTYDSTQSGTNVLAVLESIDGIICYSQRYQIYYGPIIDIIANMIVFII
jgi:hypothetical protein